MGKTPGGRSGQARGDPTAQDAKLHPDKEIESFFGQLWAVPSSSRRHPPRVSPEGLLVWVRKDLVRERRITIQECYPVRKSDRLDSKPLQLSSLRDIWGGPGRKDSYADMVKKKKMAEERGIWVWQPDPSQRPTRQLHQDPPGRPQLQAHPPPPPRQQSQGARPHPGPPPPPPPGRQQQVPQQSRPPQRFQRKPQKIQQQGGNAVDAPPTIDARYRFLTYFNCSEPGHFFVICGKPKVCFICAIPGHHMDACPRWSETHPIAKYYGSAS